MEFFRRHPLLKAALTVVVGAALGGLVAGAYAAYETRQIAAAVRAEDPHDPLDGLPFIFFGVTLLGLFAGTLVGLIVGVVGYVRSRRHGLR